MHDVYIWVPCEVNARVEFSPSHCTWAPGTDLVKLLGLHVSLPIEPSCWPNYNNFPPLSLFPLVLYSGGRTPFNLFPLVNKSLDLFLMIYGSLNF